MYDAGVIREIILGLALCTSAGACSDDSEGSCGLRTTGLSGEAPLCGNTLECGGDEWALACDATAGECTCSKNGVDEKTISYEDRFCPSDFGAADFDAHADTAAEVCGWP
jgi:hypothetical protein